MTESVGCFVLKSFVCVCFGVVLLTPAQYFLFVLCVCVCFKLF